MAIKFLSFGDIHASDTNPKSRLDDYPSTVMRKLDFIAKLSVEEQVDFSICPGDIFHKKRPKDNSHELVNALSKKFKSFHGKVLVTVGNHDFPMTLDNYEKTPLSVLEEAGALKILSTDLPIGKEGVAVSGLSYSDSKERFCEEYTSFLPPTAKFRILVLHQTLLPDGKTFFDNACVNFSELKDLGFNLIICGHYHPGYDPKVQKVGNVYFCNSGSITRGAIDDYGMTAKPTVMVFTVDDDFKLSWKEVVIPHEPAELILDHEAAKESKIRQKDLADFTDKINSELEKTYDMTTSDGIKSVLVDMSVENEVIEFSMPYIIEAEGETNE